MLSSGAKLEEGIMKTVRILVDEAVDIVANSAREMSQNERLRVSQRFVLCHR